MSHARSLLFVPTTHFLARPSLRSTSARSPRSSRILACEAPPATTPQPDIEKLFSRLSHINKNLRQKASYELSEIATPDTISRLASLLSLSETSHRRAAVQALGMTGMLAVPTVLDHMRRGGNATVRASCAKVLAAVALYFPEERKQFPTEALDLLEAALKEDPDPVTKIATVGCLGTLGCDVKARDGETIHEGCQRAVEILLQLCGKTGDMAVGASAVGAVAQIGQNSSPQRKDIIMNELRKLARNGGDDDDGFNYIREMAASHVEQLEGGTRVPRE